jgi:nucleoside phosphorylase
MNSGTGDPVWRSDLPVRQIAVIAALELEAKIPRRWCGSQCPGIYVSGPGRESAGRTAKRAIAEGARAIVAWGLAGGLSEQAEPGTIVLPEWVTCDRGRWATDFAWRGRLVAALANRFSLVGQLLYSADEVLTTRKSKADAAGRTGAAAVDMESAAIAEVASEQGVAFVAIRVVADGPYDELPDNIETLVTADGRTRMRGLAGMLGSMRQLRLLIGLARRSYAAQRQLIDVVQELARPVQ